MDKAQILADFATNWRKIQTFTVPDGALTGDNLYKFIKDFQDEIVKTISFEPLPGYEKGTLMLYSGKTNGQPIYEAVSDFCKNSNGEFYMINQTEGSSILWKEKVRDAVTNAIDDKVATARMLEGKDILGRNGTRIGNTAIEGRDLLALDDFISKMLTKAGLKNGDVVMVCGEVLDDHAVFSLTEWEEFLASAKDNQTIHIVDDISAVSKTNGVVSAKAKNVQFSATARDIRLLPDEPTTRMIFDEWGHLNFLQKLQELLKESEKVNYIGLTFGKPCAILGIVSPKYNMR